MEEFSLATFSALWLGILTSISPCPLATNITAVSYIGKQVDKPQTAMINGLLYTLGRTFVYFAIAVIILQGLSSIPAIANFLQDHINKLLGPILIITGLLILKIFQWSLPESSKISHYAQQIAAKMGFSGSFFLGCIFALSFCPVSAALFFGSLIPLALKFQSIFIMPSLYGIGTALPVVIFAIVLVFSANRISRIFNFITGLEKWTRCVTAVIFIVVGIYYTIKFLFKLV